MKKTLLLILSLFFITKFSQARATFLISPSVENLNGINSGLPTGFSVKKGSANLAVPNSPHFLNPIKNGTSHRTALRKKSFASATHIVISEIYGAGGNSGSVYKNDFIELYNPTALPISITGWSVQYASSAGTTWSSTALSGTIQPGGFYLIQQASGGTNGTNLPTPDQIGTLNLSGTAGKVLLANVTTVQTGASPAGAQIVDFVGFGAATSYEGTGPTPAPSATLSIERKATAGSTTASLSAGGAEVSSGNGYDSDNNSADFVTRAPEPQNSASPIEILSVPSPFIGVTPSTLDFGSQLNNTTSAEKTYTLNSANLNGTSVTLTASGPYKISKTTGTGFASTTTYTNAELTGSKTVYVNFTPTNSGTANGTVTTVGGGVSNPPSVSLTGVGQAAVLSADQSSLDFGSLVIGSTSTKSYTLSGSGITNDVTVSTNAPFLVSKDNNTFVASITYTAAELATAKTVNVRFSPTAAIVSTDNVVHVSTGATTLNIGLTGTGTTPPAPQAHVVISEVYGGGGNSGSTYKNDFIELYNPTNAAIDLTGWSVQYSGATNTTWQSTPLTGTIPAKSFYLIQEAAGAGGTTDLPTPDQIGTLALSSSSGKVLLANVLALQTGAKPTGTQIVDLVGFGTANGFEGTAAAPITTNSTSIERKASATSTTATLAVGGIEEFEGNGYDTDNNSTDFVTQAPNPQNSTIIEPVGANHVVISEVYGGGGNSGAIYKNDFIELYNPTNTAVDLTGWSVQYASATGTGNWSATVLSGTIPAKGFYLVQEAAGAAGTLDLPTPDKIGTLNLSGTAGKVLLSNTSIIQTGIKPTGANIIDLVGFGTANGFEGSAPAVATTNTTSIERKASPNSTAATLAIGGTEEFAGNGYDSDDNATDFILRSPEPQNSSFTEPASTTGPYLKVTPTTLAFGSQAVNSTSASKTYILSGGNLTNPVSVTATGPFTISKDGTTFLTSLNYATTDLVSNQTIYVRFKPTAIGNATGTISHVSTGAKTISLGLTGPGTDPNQTTFNFENCTTVGSSALSDGFYQYSVTGAQTWGCTTTFGHDASDPAGKASTGNALQINGYAGGNILNEDWLISPALNLSTFNYAILSFWTRSAFAGDKLQLKISTNYTGSGDPALATWTTIDGKFPETGTDVWTKSDNIDLTSYKATPVYVAIIYNSTTSSASRWTVDDFQVLNSSTPPAVDITTSPSSLSFGFQASGTTSPEKTFGFSAGNLTDDVTLTAPANFTIAKTSGGTFGNTLSYAKADINNTSQTVYAKFSPSTANTNYNGNVSIASNGAVNKFVSLTGNTFDITNSLQVVNWNIEWFGSPAQDPKDDNLQAANVKTIVNSINADIYGFAEVVDTTLFRNTVLPAGYNVIFSKFGSYANDENDERTVNGTSYSYKSTQKLAFMYRTDKVKPLNVFGVLRDTYYPSNLTNSADGSPYKNWSSGRFPFLMQAQVKINNKLDTVYFIEIHAKANTGTTAAQIDSYNRRKDGNVQLKAWIDANLKDKKVIILGDFNDVLDADKTIAPMPAGTGTSYSDFTKDVANYFPLTLPLSLAGKQSTAGFPTVIDNVIVSKSLNTNYISASAEVLDNVKSLVTNYSTTTTDHYPIKTRYLFGNGAPTLDVVADQKTCYNTTNLTIPLTGISAGPETAQTTTLSVTSDNANLFDVLTVAANGTDKGLITYHLKNNVNGVANITVTVMDNGGTDFGGVDKITKTFKLTTTAAATATVTGTTTVCLNATAPIVTFTGANGTAPYTFTYNINGGTNQTITTTAASNVATITAPANATGTFAYNLVKVNDANCGSDQTGAATITVAPLATASISGTTAIIINATAPNITFTGANGTAPYTFTYNINGGTTQTVTSVGNTATVAVPTNVAGTFNYNLVNVTDANCGQAQTGSASVIIRPLPVATIAGTTATCITTGSTAITFTGSVGTGPYTFTYNINGGTNQTITTTGVNTTVTVNATTNVAGTFNYNLVSVADAYANQNQTGTATVLVRALATASISGTTAVPQNATAPVITFTATNGTAPYTFTYNINGGTNRTVSSNTTTATVNAPTNAVGTFVYNLVNIADANCGQPQTGSATIIIRPLPVATIAGTTATCAGSNAPVVTFTGSVGTAPYTFTYNINGGSNRTITTNTTTATINAPTNTVGTFTYNLVSVSDAYANQLQTGNATVTINALPMVSITSNKGLTVSKGDALVLSATGGAQYSWTGAEIVSGQNTAAITIRPKQSGNYRVVVTNASGCTSDQTINIQIVEDYKLEAGTVLTPNGDGYNDKFIIKNIDYYPNNTLKIFDKAGRVLYTKQGYNNDWDGTLNGSPLSEGTYYYILDMGSGLGNFKGFINIIRD